MARMKLSKEEIRKARKQQADTATVAECRDKGYSRSRKPDILLSICQYELNCIKNGVEFLS